MSGSSSQNCEHPDSDSGCKFSFDHDAGVYVVVTIPAGSSGTQMVGKAWTVLAGKGAAEYILGCPVLKLSWKLLTLCLQLQYRAK